MFMLVLRSLGEGGTHPPVEERIKALRDIAV